VSLFPCLISQTKKYLSTPCMLLAATSWANVYCNSCWSLSAESLSHLSFHLSLSLSLDVVEHVGEWSLNGFRHSETDLNIPSLCHNVTVQLYECLQWSVTAAWTIQSALWRRSGTFRDYEIFYNSSTNLLIYMFKPVLSRSSSSRWRDVIKSNIYIRVHIVAVGATNEIGSKIKTNQARK
jgi:hypothetical protein